MVLLLRCGQGKPNPGVDHDAIGEWKRWDPPTHPGYLGGASMARVNDGKLKGVLHFGGLLFPPNQPIGGARDLSSGCSWCPTEWLAGGEGRAAECDVLLARDQLPLSSKGGGRGQQGQQATGQQWNIVHSAHRCSSSRAC